MSHNVRSDIEEHEGNADKVQPQMPLPPSEVLFKEERIIKLLGEVRDENISEIVDRFILLSKKDPEADIYFFINSPGGSVTAGSGLYDVMEAIPNDVVTVGLGMAASMGQFLLTAGTPGKRFAMKNLEVLLHQPHGGSGGSHFDVRTSATLINRMKNRLAGVTAARTGKTLEQVNKDGDRDRWFSSEEAFEYGMVDHIVNDLDEVFNIANVLGTQTKRSK